jgi:CDP-diglyceride synthetase
MGLDWMLGALVGGTAMLGDLFSSFIKRRLGMTASSKAPGLDQIPEALFPLIACHSWLALGLGDILVVLMLFCAGEIVLSRVLFAVGLRDRPY